MVIKQTGPCLWALGLLILAGGPSSAARGQDLAACVGEIQRVCAGMDERIEDCLAVRGASMTPVCREQLTGAISLLQSPTGPGTCVADIQRVCPSLATGALAACVDAKKAEFSSACQEFLRGAVQK